MNVGMPIVRVAKWGFQFFFSLQTSGSFLVFDFCVLFKTVNKEEKNYIWMVYIIENKIRNVNKIEYNWKK
jgi:hypothetical protein